MAALVAYLACWLAVLAAFAFSAQNLTLRNLKIDFNGPGFWLLITVPGGITFLTLLPFLKFPFARRVVFLCVWVGWLVLCSMLLNPGKTRAI
jgi:hypothetical protein